MICGNTVKLRHIEECELDSVIKLLNDIRLRGEFLGTKLISPHKLKKEFAENALSSDSSERLLIIDGYGRIVGIILHFTNAHYSTAREIGFQIFDVQARGKGYATEAVRLLVEYLFKSFTLNRLEVRMDTRNKASENVALKCGFVKEGSLRQSLFVRGKYIDLNLYGLLREEWEDGLERQIESVKKTVNNY
jgi:RimJ/RimL family protein N-acetyltransferase